jgi:tetratricopeptide (TPR) repeat protein
MTEHCTDEELQRLADADWKVMQHVRSCARCAGRQDELQQEATEAPPSPSPTPPSPIEPADTLARGESALARGAHREAREIFESGIREVDPENLPMLAHLHHRLARAYVGGQDLETAEEHFTRAASIFSGLNMPDELRSSAWARAELLLRGERFGAAIPELRSLADDFEDAEQLEEAGLCRLDLTEAFLARGEGEQAERAMRAALENFRAIDLDHRATTALAYLHQTLQGGYGSRHAIQRVRKFLATMGFGSPLRQVH